MKDFFLSAEQVNELRAAHRAERNRQVSGHYPTLLTRQQLAPWISYPVQWRTQGIGGEVLFPQAWGKFMHA